ncbi:hypothetical protein TcasGA2_TC030894 [Tribolium castaneum]|uniref:Uncharacterized protein n=1 Tax=Tribolium castaneum TaxID=7070 RepID=A0A139WGU6_TRICA|nr:hypothetical protein TcasGA2_TC030894 [Tribolium castaneum]
MMYNLSVLKNRTKSVVKCANHCNFRLELRILKAQKLVSVLDCFMDWLRPACGIRRTSKTFFVWIFKNYFFLTGNNYY